MARQPGHLPWFSVSTGSIGSQGKHIKRSPLVSFCSSSINLQLELISSITNLCVSVSKGLFSGSLHRLWQLQADQNEALEFPRPCAGCTRVGEPGISSASIHENRLCKCFGQVHPLLRPSAVWAAPHLATAQVEGQLGTQRWPLPQCKLVLRNSSSAYWLNSKNSYVDINYFLLMIDSVAVLEAKILISPLLAFCLFNRCEELSFQFRAHWR